MLKLDIPGLGILELEHLVLDYNGTLAVDGRVLAGVKPRLQRLARSLRIHVVTADTFGRARAGIALVQAEGASAEALAAADLMVLSATDALDLFLRPRRLIASLRS